MAISLCFFSFYVAITKYAYPKFSGRVIVLAVLTILPSITVLGISKIKFNYKKAFRRIVLFLCVASTLFSFLLPFGILITTRSETTDFRYYRKLDPDCLANRSAIFQELFPTWPNYFENVKNENGHYETAYLNAKYYYHFFEFLDYTYDVYAEWPLSDAEYASEVQRVKQMFQRLIEDQNNRYYRYAEVKKGNFTCLILYDGDEPFHSATDNYRYAIFAYDDEKQIVRYIFCDSLENGADQPYYLQLEW